MPKPQNLYFERLSEHFGLVIESRGCSVHDLSARFIREAYDTGGAVLFRGFRAQLDDFDVLTREMSHKLFSYQGGVFNIGRFARSEVPGRPSILTATGTVQDFAIPLHGEMYYLQHPPPVLWFYCDKDAETGGATTVACAGQFYDELDEKTQEFLGQQKIKYQRHLDEAEWTRLCQTNDRQRAELFAGSLGNDISWQHDGSMIMEYMTYPLIRDRGRTLYMNSMLPAIFAESSNLEPGSLGNRRLPFVVRSESGKPISETIVAALIKVQNKIEIPLRLAPGDMLVVDNTRVLHGRRSGTGSRRVVYVRFGKMRDLES